MITIGINLKNRGYLSFYDGWNQTRVIKRPIETLLESLKNQTEKHFKVKILDWFSDDIDINAVAENSGLDIEVESVSGNFNRSVGKNILIENCDTRLLFLIDADMITPPTLIEDAYVLMDRYDFWFPACRFEASVDGEILTDYVTNAVGNVCGKTEYFKSLRFKTGGVYNKWGNEDVNFYERAKANPLYKILRNNVDGLIHQYHTDIERKKYDD